MNSLLTNGLTAEEERALGAELSGCPPAELLKVRAAPDGLVVVIHTGQKFTYDLAAVEAAIERLASGTGRFAREAFLAELDQDAEAILQARPAAALAPRPGRRAAKGRRP
jgi:hypothetical protein